MRLFSLILQKWVLIFLVGTFAWAIDSVLDRHIYQLIDPKDYAKHKRLIQTIFAQTGQFETNGHINNIKVIEALKENGLLRLYHNEPQMNTVRFTTGGNAQFFVKLLQDTLQSLGYYRYFTKVAKRENDTFLWEIEFKAEYAIDPIVFQRALELRNAIVTKIVRADDLTWEYALDINRAHLGLPVLESQHVQELRKSLRPYWLDISQGQKLTINTMRGDFWFADIALFDKNLHLLKVYKHNKRLKELVLYLPKEAQYIKITDMFNQTNIKHGLKVLLEGER